MVFLDFLYCTDCCRNNIGFFDLQIHDSDAPWKTYLVVLEGNVEEKKPRSPTKIKTEKAGPGENKSAPRKSAATAAGDAPDAAGKTHIDSIVIPSEPVAVPAEWTSHGAITLVSHSTIGGITVIHTDVTPGTQLQPIVATDNTGTSVISLDGSAIPVPFPLPVSMAHSVPLSCEAPSTSLSVPTLSVPVSEGFLASVSQIPGVSTSSVLEAAASQTILAPVSDSKAASDTEPLDPNIQTMVIGKNDCGKNQPVSKVKNKKGLN